jgi:hypothetical protein
VLSVKIVGGWSVKDLDGLYDLLASIDSEGGTMMMVAFDEVQCVEKHRACACECGCCEW